MIARIIIVCFIAVLSVTGGAGPLFGPKFELTHATLYMQEYEEIMLRYSTKSALARWAYQTNMTKPNKIAMKKIGRERAQINAKWWEVLMTIDWKHLRDPVLKRKYKMVSILGAAALPLKQYVENIIYDKFMAQSVGPSKLGHDGLLKKFQSLQEKNLSLMQQLLEGMLSAQISFLHGIAQRPTKYDSYTSQMSETYSKAKVCDFYKRSDCSIRLMPQLETIFQNSRNEKELRYYWKAWRDAAGKPSRQNFIGWAKFQGLVAKANGLKDPVDLWNFDMDVPNFEKQIEAQWRKVEPLYKQLHAYVRHKLRKFYGPKVVSKDGPIPAHLLGNVWAQSWMNIKDIVMDDPYFHGLKDDDVTQQLKDKGFTAKTILQKAEGFFRSLGFPKLPPTFWTKSIFTRPPGVEMNCHPSAWDFHNGDVRMKLCAATNEKNFITLHHEMGHCQYYLMYGKQSYLFRNGANKGFHEAIGDTVALNVVTRKHMKKLKLLKNQQPGKEKQKKIAQLLHMGLKKIAFMPYGYLLDKYRWGVVRNEIPVSQLNEGYWAMREHYQGLEPPVLRTEDDFDPAAKHHVNHGGKYIIYFFAHILQFQLQKGLCQAAGQYDPENSDAWLSECDIYESKEAGNKFRAMLSLGSSKPWPEALKIVTGSGEWSADAFLEYFQPLYDWLKEQNKKNQVHVGWKHKIEVMAPTMSQVMDKVTYNVSVPEVLIPDLPTPKFSDDEISFDRIVDPFFFEQIET